MSSPGQPSLTEEGVTFSVVVEAVKHKCLITTQALCSLIPSTSVDSGATNIMEVFHAFEARINGVARRLVAAGVAGSPVVIRPETLGSPRTR